MNLKDKSSQNVDYLTPFLVIDYLKKIGVSNNLTKNITLEIERKGLFKNLPDLNGEYHAATFNEILSQVQSKEQQCSLLPTIVSNQCLIQNQHFFIKYQKDYIRKKLDEEYDLGENQIQFKRPIYRKKRKFKTNNNNYDNNMITTLFQRNIFIEYWNKYKTFYVHQALEIDPDDYINGSPIYNILYDYTGQYIFTGADDGLIKIFSSTNGALINVYKGHKSPINSLAVTKCGKYLASCSNDAIVRVWDVKTAEPIAVFKDHTDDICCLNIYSEPIENPTNPDKKEKYILASASDDGTIRLYFEEDYIKNKGCLKNPQKHLILEVERPTIMSKGFSTIDFHPDGYIICGTNWGALVFWDKVSNLKLGDIEKKRFIRHEHKKDAHITSWSCDGLKLITGSFDGTAKIWNWNTISFESNKDMKSIYTLEAELGKGYDVKCNAATWSFKSRYAFASFSRTITRRLDDSGKVNSNIQVFDTYTGKRMQKFEKTYDEKQIENYICILSGHPYTENILLSADYDGKIIIWDIELGVMLNCFVENCSFAGHPQINAPVLDGRFSPDGITFAVSTFYGSFSVYGYGDSDHYIPTPVEQFFFKEYDFFEVDPHTCIPYDLDTSDPIHKLSKGPLCSSKKVVYKFNDDDELVDEDILDFDANRYYKKFKNAEINSTQIDITYYDSLNSQDCIQHLKNKIPIMIEKEYNKNLEEFYKELYKDKNFGYMSCQNIENELNEQSKQSFKRLQRRGIRTSGSLALLNTNNNNNNNNNLLYNINNNTQYQTNINNNNTIRDNSEDDSDYSPPRPESRWQRKSGIDAHTEDEEFNNTSAISSIQPTTRRRTRRVIIESGEEDNTITTANINNHGISDIQQIKEQEPIQNIITTRNTNNSNSNNRRRRNRIMVNDSSDDDLPTMHNEQSIQKTHTNTNNNMIMNIENELDDQGAANNTNSNSNIATRVNLRPRSNRRINNVFRTNNNNTRSTNTGGGSGRQNVNDAESRNRRILRGNGAEHDNNEEAYLGEINCYRCGFENARIKCQNIGCNHYFHKICSEKQGRYIEGDVFNCLWCLLRKRRNDIKNTNVNKKWVEDDLPDMNNYIPQVGDQIIYIFQAHEEFLTKYFDVLTFELNGPLFPFEAYKELLNENHRCRIISISYEFPILNKKNIKGIQGKIVMNIMLSIITDTNKIFSVRYFKPDSNDMDFLIPVKKYEESLQLMKTLQKGNQTVMTLNGEKKRVFILDIQSRELNSFPNSHWKSIQLFDQSEEGYNLRKPNPESMKNLMYVSPWDIFNDKPITNYLDRDENITKQYTNDIIQDISKYYEANKDKFEPFFQNVDLEEYPDYASTVPVEMNISKILRRLNNFYYRHREALKADIRLIRINAFTYNSPTSEIYLNSELLEKTLLNITERKNDEPFIETKKNEMMTMTNMQASKAIDNHHHQYQHHQQQQQQQVKSKKKGQNENGQMQIQLVNPNPDYETEERLIIELGKDDFKIQNDESKLNDFHIYPDTNTRLTRNKLKTKLNMSSSNSENDTKTGNMMDIEHFRPQLHEEQQQEEENQEEDQEEHNKHKKKTRSIRRAKIKSTNNNTLQNQLKNTIANETIINNNSSKSLEPTKSNLNKSIKNFDTKHVPNHQDNGPIKQIINTKFKKSHYSKVKHEENTNANVYSNANNTLELQSTKETYKSRLRRNAVKNYAEYEEESFLDLPNAINNNNNDNSLIERRSNNNNNDTNNRDIGDSGDIHDNNINILGQTDIETDKKRGNSTTKFRLLNRKGDMILHDEISNNSNMICTRSSSRRHQA